jgi:hypothetical protein
MQARQSLYATCNGARPVGSPLLRTGRESACVEEEVELIAAIEAGEHSLQLGREVTIAEVLKG